MAIERLAGLGRLRRGAPALVTAALTVGGLAGGGPAAAAARLGGAPGPRGGPGAGVISTVAGGVGGPATATHVALSGPCGVSFGTGHLYVADHWSVRRVSPATDRLTTPAGTGRPGPVGEGGSGAKASVFTCGATVDHSGNLVIADSLHNRVRVLAANTGTFYGKAMKAGHIYTVAGNGTKGFSGDGGPATSARFKRPGSVAVDTAGNLLIADTGNNRVRAVAASTGTFYGHAMTAGNIYTVAGGGDGGDGGPGTGASLSSPVGVAADTAGNLLIADAGDQRVRVVAGHTGTFYGQAMTAGNIYTVAGTGTQGFSGDGGPATSARLSVPEGVAVDAAGNLLIADTGNNRVRVAAGHTGTFYGQAMTAGNIYSVAGTGGAGFSGDGGPATSARLNSPDGVAADTAGNLLIADFTNTRVRAVAASTGTFYGKAMTAGHIYTVAGTGVDGFSGDGGPATSAELNNPNGAVADATGNLLIADTSNNRVRVAAGGTGTFYGKPMTAGHIYTVAGTGVYGFSGDGGPGTSAALSAPEGVAADAAGNLLITDTGTQRIRVVAARTGTFYGQAMTAGHIYTVAGTGVGGFSGDGGPAISATLANPDSVAVDAAGNLLITDADNQRIRVVAARTGTFYDQPMTAGDIYTVAGGGSDLNEGIPATLAQISPRSSAADAAGNLVIADRDHHRIRVVASSTGTFYGKPMTIGDIYTVAGTGNPGFSGDGGPATSAKLAIPDGVAVDAAGNLVIADTGNARVRVVAARTGTFYGQAMTAGNIYTVAGNGTFGFSGDGGPATKAKVPFPVGVAVTAAGNLLIADADNNRIRMVTG